MNIKCRQEDQGFLDAEKWYLIMRFNGFAGDFFCPGFNIIFVVIERDKMPLTIRC